MELNLAKIYQGLTSSISSPNLYWQLLVICSCLFFSYFFYQISKKYLVKKPQEKLFSKNKTITKNPASGQSALGFAVAINLANSSKNDSDKGQNSKFSKIESKNLLIWSLRYLASNFLPLLLPLIALICFLVGFFVYSAFFKEGGILMSVIQVIAMIFFLRIIRISSQSSFTAKVVGVVLLPTLILHIFGVLEPFSAYLDNLDFKIGKARLSVYLIIKGLIVVLLAIWLANLLSRKSRLYVDNNRNIKPSTKGIINKIADILIYSIALIFVLKSFGFDLTTFAVIGGAVGVGIGLGLQKIASNFISGIILLFEKSVEVGDIVEINDGQIYGTIRHFSGRYTLVESVDGKEALIPNEEFITQRVINWTHSNSRARIEIKVGVAYGSDLQKVKEIMMRCASNHRRCLVNPEVECFVVNFGDFSIEFVLYFWVADVVAGRFGPKSDVLMAIYEEFAREGVKIPFPQREMKILD